MQFPTDYKYAKEHAWLKLLDDGQALVGITEFAQSELGEIVYVDLPAVGKTFKQDEIFGSVEAVKTTSDLYMPVSGLVLAVNSKLAAHADLVNTDAFEKGWMMKLKLTNTADLQSLYDAACYQTLIG